MENSEMAHVIGVLESLGVTVWRDGYQLKVRAPPEIMPAARRQIAALRMPLLRHFGATEQELKRAEVEAALPPELLSAVRLAFDELGVPDGTIELRTPQEGLQRWT